MKPATVVYCRISRDREGQALGVDRQRRECVELCERHGWTVGTIFTDNDVSAYSGKIRPHYRAMMDAVRSGAVSRIVAWHPDRLHRSPRELEDFIEAIERNRVRVETVHAGHWDLSTASGRMTARTLGSVARYESEHRSERVLSKLEENAQKGSPHGRRTFGWDRQRGTDGRARDVINESEADLIRKGTAGIVGGDSLAAVTRMFADSAVPPPGAASRRHTTVWHKASVRAVLLRPRNAGMRQHHGEILGRGTWEPIVTEGEMAQLITVLRDPSRRTSTGTAAKHLLSGIARCGVCETVVHAYQNRTTESYRCKGRGCVSRNRRDVDHFVAEVVLGYLEREDIGALIADDNSATVRAAHDDVSQLRARLDVAADDYADGKIDSRQLARITARLRPEIDAAESRAASFADTSAITSMVVSGDVRAAWNVAALTHKRAIVSTLADVHILRASQGARVFDPESICIEWRATT